MRKPTLVMIHGLIGSLRYFDPEQRIRRGHVRSWELLGYGALENVPPNLLTLSAQAGYITDCITRHAAPPVWVLGHSMGGAIAMLLAAQHPELISGIINVEGNFTFKDAFWSGKIKDTPADEWEREYAGMRADVRGWLTSWGVDPSDQAVEWGQQVLDWQPASTVRLMAGALVRETTDPAYEEAVHRVVERGTPIDLIAGGRSAADWDVPEFVRESARSYSEIGPCGHLMMLEDPDAFCRVVDGCLAEDRRIRGS